MPKKLLAEGLCARCRAPLDTVEVVSIANDNIGDLGETLEACTQLRSIYLGSNLLQQVRVLEACRELWRIDLADNTMRNLDGIEIAAERAVRAGLPAEVTASPNVEHVREQRHPP